MYDVSGLLKKINKTSRDRDIVAYTGAGIE